MKTSVLSESAYKLKLCSKKLKSGKFQVRFHASRHSDGHDLYGYILAEPKDTLKRVVTTIKSRLNLMEETSQLSQKELYSNTLAAPSSADFTILKH